MIKNDIESTFYTGQVLPEAISKVCEFLDENGYPISGCFELSTIGVDDLKGWFKKTPSAVDTLLPFGRGACGDIYAVWLVNNLELENSPIVMFGSEGTLSVLARNAKEFCKLLCLGYSELGLEDHSLVGDDFSETKPFRDFILGEYNFELPQTGNKIIEEANQAFPEFTKWVEGNAWE
jgi:hypothetical protein